MHKEQFDQINQVSPTPPRDKACLHCCDVTSLRPCASTTERWLVFSIVLNEPTCLQDLTQCLYEFLIDRCCGGTCHILGVDIDPVLVERARHSNIHRDNVLYDCVDVTCDQDREELFSQYLWKHGRAKFDIVFCFSVTMWIHLNSGDEGLTKFLTDICRQTDWLVVEPQPWKCYKEAERRLRRSGGGSFPLFPSLTMRGRVERDIESILQQQCQFTKVLETSKTRWNRKLSFYRTNSLSESRPTTITRLVRTEFYDEVKTDKTMKGASTSHSNEMI
ncbi:unnamed protein product, partial [Timema podura]|nr:unnamed protein product [Timema podura]